ncbi:type VII secretion protein EccE [Plantactinospora sp. GCM10030261]|uniref:type VII secretion protein EccE n=1 Tax=Plantactinospora sp. GCM10030261 TaxID=3273420 RepID=UPI003622D48B
MTERNGNTVASAPQPARDVVRTGTAEAVLRPRRRPGHLGSLHVMQLLAVEAAIVAVLASLASGIAVVIGAGVAAVLLLALALARHRGRWWLERRLIRRDHRRRRRNPGGTTGDRRLDALRVLAPGLSVEDVKTPSGARVGVARDSAGWYAVAEVSRAPGDSPTEVPVDTLAEALMDVDQPGAVLQVVVQTVPAPSVDTHPSVPAGYSYRHLIANFGGEQIPADQTTWLTVRLDARSLAEAMGQDGSALDEAPALTAALARRVARSLTRHRLGHRLLDAEALVHALARSCDLEPLAEITEPVRPREDWTQWHSARLTHRTFWVRTWPEVDQVGTVLRAMTGVPAAMSTIALTLMPEPRSGLLDLRGLVRIAAPAAELGQVAHLVGTGARQAGADLFPVDGEQGPAVYASAPTGGGPR